MGARVKIVAIDSSARIADPAIVSSGIECMAPSMPKALAIRSPPGTMSNLVPACARVSLVTDSRRPQEFCPEEGRGPLAVERADPICPLRTPGVKPAPARAVPHSKQGSKKRGTHCTNEAKATKATGIEATSEKVIAPVRIKIQILSCHAELPNAGQKT